MVEAIKNDALIQQAPAIVGCKTASALQATRTFSESLPNK
jgi:hypothetical protein